MPVYEWYRIMRECKDKKTWRIKLVLYAQDRGLRAAARAFKCSRNTVRTWTSRFDGKLASLEDHSRRPRRSPNKTPAREERRILEARRKLPGFGAKRLKDLFGLSTSDHAINRCLRERGLLRKWRKKKRVVRNNLRHIKKKWRLFQQITVDTKDLSDIPNYWVQMKRLGLPRYQYTARDVTTGILSLGFSDELSLTYAELFAKRFIEHMKRFDCDLARTTWQSDNGSEFIGSWQAREKSAFTLTIESVPGQRHRTIPPGAHTWQGDVETVHNLVEMEFFDIETFTSRPDFLRKATVYQHFFNFARRNSYKENKTPITLALEKKPTLDPRALLLPPVFLEEELDKRIHPRILSPPFRVDQYVPSLA